MIEIEVFTFIMLAFVGGAVWFSYQRGFDSGYEAGAYDMFDNIEEQLAPKGIVLKMGDPNDE